MLRSTHREAIDELSKELVSSERLVHLLDDRLTDLRTTMLEIVAKASQKHSVMTAITDFWTLYHEHKSAEILALRAEIDELKANAVEKTLDEQLDELDSVIKFTIESKPLVSHRRQTKRHDLEKLQADRTALVEKINRAKAPVAEIQVST